MRRLWLALLVWLCAPALALAIYPYPSRLPIASAPATSVDFRADYDSGVSGATMTFASADIGTATATRTVVVSGFFLYSSGTGHAAPTLTIGGTSAPARQSFVDDTGAQSLTMALYSANIPSGATADIVATADSADLSIGSIGVWALDGVDAVPATTASDSGSVVDLSQNVVAGDVFVGAAACLNAGAPSFAWSGAAEDFEQDITTVGVYWHTGASQLTAGTESPRTFTATPSTCGIIAAFGVGAIWQP